MFRQIKEYQEMDKQMLLERINTFLPKITMFQRFWILLFLFSFGTMEVGMYTVGLVLMIISTSFLMLWIYLAIITKMDIIRLELRK